MEKTFDIINLTPHEIKVVLHDGSVHTFAPSGNVARVTSTPVHTGFINGIPVVANVFSEVEGLPEPQENTIYIVSSLVLQAVGYKRKDLVAPDTSPAGAVRDENGQIIGVRRFQIYTDQ